MRSASDIRSFSTVTEVSAPRGKTRVSMRRILRSAFAHGLLIVLSACTLIPFLWMVLASFKPLVEVESIHPIPTEWHPENYLEVFRKIAFARYYFNSVFVASWTTFVQCFTSAMAGYAFARLRWRGRDTVFKLYLATMMVPWVVTVVPNFALMVQLRLLNTYAALIVPASFGAFGTFLMRQFMLTIPSSLDEAASIDGASPWRIFSDIILPLARPGLFALAIFTFLASYASLFWPLILIKSDYLRTLPIGMLYFDTAYEKATHLLMAASVMNILPLIVLFVCTQKYLVRGIQLGAVKG
jgi:multiple sugar transport system permease protein